MSSSLTLYETLPLVNLNFVPLNGALVKPVKQTSNKIKAAQWSWPSGWCVELRNWFRGFDAQQNHLP